MTPSTHPFDIVLPDAAATERVGAALGRVVRPGDVVLLIGGLGAGKTALARAAISARLAAVGMAEDIPSPTFTLVQTYQADIPVWHADLYRLSGEDEAWELGLTDAFDEAACFIEWPDRLGGILPLRHVVLTLTIEGEGRRLCAAPNGEGWQPVLSAMMEAV